MVSNFNLIMSKKPFFIFSFVLFSVQTGSARLKIFCVQNLGIYHQKDSLTLENFVVKRQLLFVNKVLKFYCQKIFELTNINNFYNKIIKLISFSARIRKFYNDKKGKLPTDITNRSNLILRCGDIHKNPGPVQSKVDIVINSFNARGLK